MLNECIEQAANERQRLSKEGREIEVEIRLGVRADENGRRSEKACRWFASNIGETHFFATFHILAQSAMEISEKSMSIHNRYASEVAPPAVRCEIDGESQERWTWKNVLSHHDFTYTSSWFDVRIAVSEEKRIVPPSGILEARQMATRVHNAWEQPRTRLSLPVHIRRRFRRSLRFACASAWRVDFTEVQSSQRVEGFHNSVIVSEHAFVNNDDTREIELELINSVAATLTVQEIARQATCLLSMLATALGTSASESRLRIAADRRTAELQKMLAQSVSI